MGNRWWLIGTIAVTTVITGLFLVWLLHDHILAFTTATPTWVPLVVVITLFVVWAGSSRRHLAALGLRHALTYPPYWLGVSLGTATSLLIAREEILLDVRLRSDQLPWLDPSIITLYALPLLAVMFAAIRSCRRRTAPDRRPETENSVDEGWAGITEFLRIKRQEELLAWIHHDRPISTNDADLFKAAPIARRMASRLASPEPSAQALIGALGAGKSSVRNLVQAELDAANLRRAKQIVLVPVELWRYETTQAAVQGVIRALVSSLAREVSVFRLSGLPEKYAQVITSVNSRLSVLSHVFEAPKGAAELLEVFDEVARCIGFQYVLWVEDLERFAPGKDRTARDMAEAEKLAPIRALLHSFDALTNVSVVTATTDLFVRFDLDKIARHVERISPLDPDDVRQVIVALRDYWTERAGPYRDLASRDHHQHYDWRPDPQAREFRRMGLLDEITTVADAVVALARSPRVLKQILRGCNERWKRLRGEIDLDQMIAVLAIRESLPTAFALLERDFDRLRYARSSARRGEPDKAAVMEAFTKELVACIDAPRAQKAAKLIVQHLFDNPPPQGLAQRAHVDYWERFLAVPEIEANESDQAILELLLAPEQRAVGDPKQHEPLDLEPIVSALLDQRSAAIEHFRDLLSDETLNELMVRLAARLAVNEPQQWADEHPPGLVSLWRMFQNRRRSGPNDGMALLIRKSFEQSVSRNLPVFFEIEYWFLAHGENLTELVSSSERDRLRHDAREMMLYEYAGRPKELVASLRGAKEHLLLWLLFGIERVRNNDRHVAPFEDWEPLRDTILEAMADSPETMLSLVAPLVTKERRLETGEYFEFDRDTARILFGDVDLLLLLFQQPTRRSTARVDCLRQAAAELDVMRDAQAAFVSELTRHYRELCANDEKA